MRERPRNGPPPPVPGRRGAAAPRAHVRVLALGGASLLVVSAGVHLDLYETGYRNIPAIGTLFLVQVAVAIVLSAAVAVASISRRARTPAVCILAALFALGTVAAYGASRAGSVFGFHERPTTAGLVAGVVEVAAFVALGAAGVSGATRGRAELLGVFAASAAMLAVVLVSGIGASAAPVAAAHRPRVPERALVVHVVISGYAFHPSRVTARPGEEIEVTNEDQVVHTMTAVPGSVPFGGFGTGSITPGATAVIHAPTAPGAYRFYCSIHIFMKGLLEVRR